MKADLVARDDVCKFEFDYIDSNNQLKWIAGGGINNSKIHDLLIELRTFTLSQNQPYWKGCEFKFDLDVKFHDKRYIL